jgi:hypothetical protein
MQTLIHIGASAGMIEIGMSINKKKSKGEK